MQPIMLNSLEKNGDCFAAALGPDERTCLGSHLRRHNMYFARSWLAAVLRCVVLHAETNNAKRLHFSSLILLLLLLLLLLIIIIIIINQIFIAPWSLEVTGQFVGTHTSHLKQLWHFPFYCLPLQARICQSASFVSHYRTLINLLIGLKVRYFTDTLSTTKTTLFTLVERVLL